MKPSIRSLTNLFLFLFLSLGTTTFAQIHSHASTTKVSYPDIPGYLTLSTDLHIHSAFSDGSVWPNIRVMEALREDLDAIALTEHLEYQPHATDIPHPDRNRAHELALKEAKDHDLLIVQGSEITRSEPVGHNNAIFLEDSNPLLDVKDPNTAFKEAKKQGAFVFWNHPAWYRQSPKGTPILSDFQKQKIKKNMLQGIEVINEGAYSEEALQLALDYDLTIMSTSDIHDLIEWDYIEKGVHRPITLVFAKERSIEGIKEALFARRTVAVFNDLWVGKKDFLIPLLKQTIQIDKVHYLKGSHILSVTLTNLSSSNLLFENSMPYSFYYHPRIFTIPAKESITLQIKTLEPLDRLQLQLKALKAYVAPKEQAEVSWEVVVPSGDN